MKSYIGVELGSTRIKAVAINEKHQPISSADYLWASDFKNGIWTYNLDEAWTGLKSVIKNIENPESIAAMGVSGMMHGYLAFDEDWNLLVPFRTWQNTITADASKALTELLNFNIPQRWSISHLYQAILNDEEHVKDVAVNELGMGYATKNQVQTYSLDDSDYVRQYADVPEE